MNPNSKPQSLRAAYLTASGGAMETSGFNRIVAYGDSLAADMARDNPGIVNLGISGSGLLQGRKEDLERLVQQINPRDLVIVSIGTNDAEPIMNGVMSIKQYKDAFRQRIEAIEARGASVIVLGVSTEMNPSWVTQKGWMAFLNDDVNKTIKEVAALMNVAFSPTGGRGLERQVDGLHYTEKGSHQLFRNAISDRQLRPEIRNKLHPEP